MPAEAAKACRPRRIHEFVARARSRRIHALRYSHAFAAQLTFRDKRPSLKGRESMAPGANLSCCPGHVEGLVRRLNLPRLGCRSFGLSVHPGRPKKRGRTATMPPGILA